MKGFKGDIRFDEFSALSREEWLAKLKESFKTDALENHHVDLDNFHFDPFTHFSHSRAYAPIDSNRLKNDWSVAEFISFTGKEEEINNYILEALSMGADSLGFEFKEGVDYEKVFKGVNFEYIKLVVESSSQDTFANHPYWKNKADLLKGYLFTDSKKLENSNAFPGIKKFGFRPSDQIPVLDQLSDFLAQAQMKISDKSNSLINFPNQFYVLTGVNKSYFLEIAKIRALRILWHNLMAANGMSSHSIDILSYPSTTVFDENSNTNLIKSTTIALSAIIGGSDLHFSMPFPFVDRGQHTFYQRINRNIQHLASLESSLAEVKDPAAGSYYLEELTDQLVLQSWEKFISTLAV